MACETGIPPSQLLAEDDRMLFTMKAYLRWKALEAAKAYGDN